VSRLALISVIALSLLPLSACTNAMPGEVLVRIEVDPRLPVQTLRVAVTLGDGSEPMSAEAPVRGSDRVELPWTVAIQRASSTEAVIVELEGRESDGTATVRRAALNIAPGVSSIDLALDASCRGVVCEQGESCAAGSCAPIPSVEAGRSCGASCLGRCLDGLCLPSLYRPFPTLALGGRHTCAVMQGVVRCWGNNDHIQLGPDALNGVGSPLIGGRVLGLAAAATEGELSSGEQTCALLETGVLCWGGTNDAGQLGPEIPPPWDPFSVAVPGATRIATQERTLYWLEPTGLLRVQGGGLSAQGLSNPSGEPVVFPDGEAVVDVSVGDGVGCAILTSRRVACWGDNRAGVIDPNAGGGTNWAPTIVDGLSDVVRIAVTLEHACAVTSSGAMRCWGTDFSGSLCAPADGAATIDVELPEAAMDVALGFESTCVITVTGRTFCCGVADAFSEWRVPRELPEVARATEIVGSHEHRCARGLEGDVWCWGENISGCVDPTACSEPGFCGYVDRPRQVVLP